MKQLIILAAVLLSACTSKQEVITAELTEVSKRCNDYLFDECVTYDVVKTFTVKNVHDKDIKAISFKVQFLDILNNVKGEQSYNSTQAVLKSGYSKSMSFAGYYNQYSNLDYFVLHSDLESIRTKVTVSNVIFTDGTTNQ